MVRPSGKEKTKQIKAARRSGSGSPGLPMLDAGKMAEARRRLGSDALQQLNAPITSPVLRPSPPVSSSSSSVISEPVPVQAQSTRAQKPLVRHYSDSYRTPAPAAAASRPAPSLASRTRSQDSVAAPPAIKKARVSAGGQLMDLLDDDAKAKLGTHVPVDTWLEAIASLRGSETFIFAQIDRRTEIRSSEHNKLELTVHSLDLEGTADNRSLLLSFQGDVVDPVRTWLDQIVTANGGPESPIPLRIIISGWAAVTVAHEDHVYFRRHVLFPGRACMAFLRAEWLDTILQWFEHPPQTQLVYTSDAHVWAAISEATKLDSATAFTSSYEASTSDPTPLPLPSATPAERDAFARNSSPEFNFDTPQNSGRVIKQPSSASTAPSPASLAGPSRSMMASVQPTSPHPRPSQPPRPKPSQGLMRSQLSQPERGSLLESSVSPVQDDTKMMPFDLSGMEFIPLNCLKTSQRVSMIAVVDSSNEVTRAQGGSRDFSITIQVRDNSHANHLVSIQIWRSKREDLPKRPKSGDIIIVRHAYVKANTVTSTPTMQVTLYNRSERRTGVHNAWAVMSVASDSGFTWTRSPGSELSEEEKVYAQRLAQWGREELADKESTNEHVRQRRMQVTLDKARDSLFCDLAVECIGIQGADQLSGDPPSLLVTDYTVNPHFRKRDDCHLYNYITEGLAQPPASLQALTDGIGGGRVLLVRLYQETRYVLHAGDLVGRFYHLRNVRCRAACAPMLEATVGNTNLMRDDQSQVYVDIQRLDSETESVRAINERKRDYIMQVKEGILYPDDPQPSAPARTATPSRSGDDLSASNKAPLGQDANTCASGSQLALAAAASFRNATPAVPTKRLNPLR